MSAKSELRIKMMAEGATEREYIKEYHRQYRIKNKEQIKKVAAAKKEHNREMHVLRRYGVQPEQYRAMLKEQKNCCPICGKKFIDTPHVDHCHKSGIVRGLLCGDCNIALGYAHDNISTLAAMIDYLNQASLITGTRIT